MQSEVNQSSEIKSQIDSSVNEKQEEKFDLKNEQKIDTSLEPIESADLDTRPISPLMALSLKIGEVWEF